MKTKRLHVTESFIRNSPSRSYAVVSASDLAELSIRVNDAILNHGGKPQGGIAVSNLGDDIFYCQAVTFPITKARQPVNSLTPQR